MLIHAFSARLFVALLFSASVVATANSDRLDTPAISQVSPERMLLISIDRAGSRLVTVGEHGLIIFSDDGGLSWNQADVPVSSMLTSVHFFDNQKGWAVGHDAVILKTDDAGKSWVKVTDGNALNKIRANAIENALTELAAKEPDNLDALEELEYKFDDAAVALEEGAGTPLLDIHFLNGQTGFAIGAYGQLYRSDDQGLTWQYIGHQLPNPDSLHFNAFFKAKNGDLYLLGEAGLLLKSSDQGSSWLEEDVPYDGSFFSAVESDAIYLMGLRGNVFKKMADGSWENQAFNSTSTINDAVVVQGKAILVGQGGALIRQDRNQFVAMGAQGLRTFTSVAHHGGNLIVVGESGVKRIELEGGR